MRKKLDLKKLVDELHAIDVKAMLWFSVPYVGIASAAAKRFRGKTLYYDEKVKAYALDPRFGEVRKYLVDTYVDFLRRYDLDGFKIDFIDVFMLTDQSSADYDAMDFVSLEDGVVALMHEISARLKSLKPDILLEFRESYVGPAMQQYGNMFRVGDCPGNAIRNKNVSVGLRLFADGAAVHSDPIMWNRSESVEDAAMQLNHSLFCVPQISVDLTRLPIDHRNMLAYYLRYQRDNRQTLLFSPLDVKGFAQNFVSVTACDDRKQITAIFLETTTELQPGRDIDLVNASPTGVVLVRATEQMSAILTVCDCMGETVYETEFAIDGGVREIAVPVSGFAFFRGIKTYENRV